MRLAVLAVVPLLLAVAHPAHAAPPSMTDPSVTPTPPPSELKKTSMPRNPRTGTALAIAGTLLGPILLYATDRMDRADANDRAVNTLGLIGGVVAIVGPSWGHWYGGKALTGGLGLRLLGVGLATVGAVVALSCLFEENCDADAPAGLLMLGGAGSYLAGTIWDLSTAAKQVRRWNDEHATVSPTAMRTDHGAAAGLALSGHF